MHSEGAMYYEYYFFVHIDKEEERLTVYKDFWNTLAEEQYIELCLQKGVLGFDYISIQQ